MTGDCDWCRAVVALHMMTQLRKTGRVAVRYLRLCPACYARWWDREVAGAVSAAHHTGGAGRPRKDV